MLSSLNTVSNHFKLLNFSRFSNSILNLSNLKFISSSASRNQRILTQSELTERLKKKKSTSLKKFKFEQPQSDDQTPKLETKQTFKMKTRDPKLNDSENRLYSLENEHLVSEVDKIKLMDNTKEIIESSNFIHQEKSYLNQVSFKIRNDLLDDEGKELLAKMQSLTKTSVDPKHLTILHSSLSSKIVNILFDRIFSSEANSSTSTLNTFVELQPGFGLITKNLIELCNSNFQDQEKILRLKFILIEQFSKFMPSLKDLKLNYGKKYDIQMIKARPFQGTFLFEKNASNKENFLNSLLTDNKHLKDIQLSLFGIVPWNSKDFLNNLYSSYCTNSGFFGLNTTRQLLIDNELDLNIKTPDFYLYLPEVFLARLNPNFKEKYKKSNSKLAVFSNLLTKVEILNEEKCDFFFPYPLVSTPFKYSQNKFDNKNMFLVNIKFNVQDEILVKNKRLFFLFVSQLFCRPSDNVKKALGLFCTNAEIVCEGAAVSKYAKIKGLSPYQILKLFKFLLENKELSSLNEVFVNDKYLLNDEFKEFKPIGTEKRDDKDRKIELKALKSFNKDLSGKFVVPSDLDEKFNKNKDKK